MIQPTENPQRFQSGEYVTIYNTTSKDLDGQRCEVLGRNAVHPLTDFYIILLERPVVDGHGYEQRAISMPETCLRPT